MRIAHEISPGLSILSNVPVNPVIPGKARVGFARTMSWVKSAAYLGDVQMTSLFRQHF